MARLFGRILSSIWDDEDFIALEPLQQRLYMFLLSQPDLNHAGLLPLTFKRWSDSAKDLTAAQIEADLIDLEVRRFVVLDFDKEELLVRSLVRNDGVWKQPRVMGAMVSNAMAIRSRKLRRALLAEIDRLPLDELSETPGKPPAPGKPSGPSVRAQVDAHIADLRRAYGPIQPPPEPPHEPLPEEVPEWVREEPVYGPAEDVPEEDPQASTRACAGPQARAYPYPVTPVSLATPLNPAPAAALFELPASSAAVVATAAPLFEAAPAARDDDPIEEEVLNAGTLVAEWLQYRGEQRPSGRIIGQVGKHLKTLLAEIPYDVVREAFQLWENRGLDPAKLDSCVNQVQAARRRDAASRPSAELALAVSGSNVVSFQSYANRVPGQRVSATRRAVDQAEAAGEEAKRMLAAMQAGSAPTFTQIGSGA